MLNIFTIVLNGGDYLKRHLPVFEQLTIPWKWIIAHGPANNGGSTKWCTPQKPGLSTDGTTEYIRSIAGHPNIWIEQGELWPSKDDMCNTALARMDQAGVLMQVDSDEIWTSAQLEEIVRLFQDFPQVGSMRFNCNYFVGPDLVAVGEDAWGGNDNSWLRAWRFTPGMRFKTHEPPVLEGANGYCMTRHETARCGLVFDHFAYATEAQVRYKQGYYGPAYSKAVAGWRRLQAQQDFPTPLRQFFPWLRDDRTIVQRYQKGGDEPCALLHSHQQSQATPSTVNATNASASSAAPKFDPKGAVKRFCHSGDLGDCISSLPSVRALGGGTYVVTDTRDGQRGSMRDRFASLKSLLEVQPYISGVEWQDAPTGITHDFRGFRPHRDKRQNLAENHAQHLRTDIRLDPWLTAIYVEPHKRVVFARSSRYQNANFPWVELAKHYGAQAVFVGLEDEHAAFQKFVGRSLEYHKTADLLELARYIAGASLFVGNQSLPLWLATGTGTPLWAELWERDPNVIVERPTSVYPRLHNKVQAMEFLLTHL